MTSIQSILLSGTNVTYTLDLGLSTQVVEVGDDLSDVHINVSYPDEGMYYINLTAWNVVGITSMLLLAVW